MEEVKRKSRGLWAKDVVDSGFYFRSPLEIVEGVGTPGSVWQVTRTVGGEMRFSLLSQCSNFELGKEPKGCEHLKAESAGGMFHKLHMNFENE